MTSKINAHITHTLTGPIGTNTYVLENNPPIVIDPGYGVGKIVDQECIVLLTHMHFDHICGLTELKPLKVYISKSDLKGLSDAMLNKSHFFGTSYRYMNQCEIFANELKIGDWHFQIIETPGHTPGSVVFVTDKVFFTGDTIFIDSIGRTDFPESDENSMLESLKKLSIIFKKTDPNSLILPGHMEYGTVADVLEKNLFLREALR
ncbi:MAG TPA: MBL fold metallo-hydrolase [Pseudothermotoga sp.]|uniref:MBL fold metallo-hydrolase n=1 Tax=Thermotoga profunda TaxID=1508420 RepID=UPI000693D044|nr:MBL fold metallo-hydrolase [Thermotoga profunda]